MSFQLLTCQGPIYIAEPRFAGAACDLLDGTIRAGALRVEAAVRVLADVSCEATDALEESIASRAHAATCLLLLW
eukprot:4799940-Pleurochrysis_carterae.AAC.3